MMPRLQITISAKIDEMLRKDALRRIRDNDDAGRRTESVVRDLVLGCVMLSFDEVRGFTKAELDILLRRSN